MNRVEELSNAGRGYARAWRDFITQYTLEPSNLYCFFEGTDDPKYYGLRIDSIVFRLSQSSRRNIWCDGKYNLINLYELISQHKQYQKAWTAFFLDLDFDSPDELPNVENVYITPCYSIENLYLAPNSVRIRSLFQEGSVSQALREASRRLA